MYRYGQFCPMAAACEVFAERWTPLVLRELFAGSRRFNELRRGVPLMSRTLLAQRLRELEDAGIVERIPKASGRGHEYRLSAAGAELQPVIMHLGEWGRRWVSTRVSKDNLDPGLLMWDIHRRIDTGALPERRLIVQFDLHGLPRGTRAMQRWWLLLHRPEVELCLKDPGGEVDLSVAADLHALTRVWVGELSLKDAARQRLVVLRGPAPLVKAFPGWLMLGVFADRAGRATA